MSSAVSSAQGMFHQESASLQEEYSVNETSENAVTIKILKIRTPK